MSKLDAAERKKLPKGDFALPGGRFPIEDAGHARDAISGASHSEHVGNITEAQKETVDRKAEAKLKHPTTRQAIRGAYAKVHGS